MRQSDAHAWAEVYFADHGWVPFDSSPYGNAASMGASIARGGYFFNAEVGDTVVGAVKSAPGQLIGAALDLVRNPIFAILTPALLAAGIILRWIYFRAHIGRSNRKWTTAYQANLGGEARRELLKLYGQLERLLRRRSGILRKPWQTVGDFATTAGAAEPRIQPQLDWFTQSVWHAAYNPEDVPTGMVEEARRHLSDISGTLKSSANGCSS